MTFMETAHNFDLAEIIAKAEEWDDRYLQATVHAINRYEIDDCEKIVRRFLSRKSRDGFNATNSHSKRVWLPQIIQSFWNIQKKRHGRGWQEALATDVAAALVTFTDSGWACADTNIRFDLQRAKQKVRNAL